MNRLLFLILVMGVSCGLSSCNLWRSATGKRKVVPVADSASLVIIKNPRFIGPDTGFSGTDTTTVNTAESTNDARQQALIQSLAPLWNAQTMFTTFNGKAKVHYEGKGESQDFSVVIRIEKDRKIWVSITGSLLGLSLEAARALITPDTIIAIDRIHKEVRILPLSEIGKLLPAQMDFSTLQSLIIGDILPASYPLNGAADTGQAIFLRAVGPDYSLQVSFSKSDTTITAQTLAAGEALFQAIYYNYSLIAGRRFASNRDLASSDKGEAYLINLDFSKAAFDEPVDMSFSIPAKYERK